MKTGEKVKNPLGTFNNAFLPGDQRLLERNGELIFCLSINPKFSNNMINTAKPGDIIMLTQIIKTRINNKQHKARYCTHLVTPIDSPTELIEYENETFPNLPGRPGRWVKVIAMANLDIPYALKWPYRNACLYNIRNFHTKEWISNIWEKFQPFMK